MMSLKIEGATHRLGEPEKWPGEVHGRCSGLWCRQEAGNIWCSAWEPTPAELAILNAGGRVVLAIYGGQPPVSLQAERAPAVPANN